MSSALAMTAAVAAVFAVRLVVYGYGYLQGQIGGAQISRSIRIFLGEKIKRIPLSRFTERSSGDYLNALTVNVNDYEQILTHKTGSIAKNAALATMLVAFVTWLYAPAGIIVAAMYLLIVPGLAYSWRQVRRFGARKSAIQVSNVSAIVEHVTGMQTLRAYGIGGTANERIVESMRSFSDISYRYEAAVTPPGAVLFALVGMGAPALFLVCGSAVLAGTLDAVSAVLIIMLPLFIIKMTTALFVDLTAYRNLSIAKRRIAEVASEEEEQGVDAAFPVGDAGIELAGVDFAYERDNPVFCGLDLVCSPGRLTALVGDSGCGKSTALSLVAQYYRPDKGSVLIGGADTAAYAPRARARERVDRRPGRFPVRRLDCRKTCATPNPAQATRRSGRRAAWRTPTASSRRMPEGYDSRIGETGRASREASGSGFPSPAPSCGIPPSCCLTRRRHRSTSKTSWRSTGDREPARPPQDGNHDRAHAAHREDRRQHRRHRRRACDRAGDARGACRARREVRRDVGGRPPARLTSDKRAPTTCQGAHLKTRQGEKSTGPFQHANRDCP